MKMQQKSGFTLVELLTVIAVISLLLAILMPVLSRAREQAKVLVVNAELYNIALALEAYAMDHKNVYPPAHADCNGDVARTQWWSLPVELANQLYLPKGTVKTSVGTVQFSRIEDKFNAGCTYKYVSVGTCVDNSGTPFKQYLQIAPGFPNAQADKYIFTGSTSEFYCDPKTSPVTWCLFSLGPKYKNGTNIQDGFPVSRQFWYSVKKRGGIIIRTRLLDGRHIGTFGEEN
jgi:prepilin-type N-terminal cleavage/methylation domain-containing protein